ncbi:ABC transporter permease [Frankia sp. AgKG'84/4]|uniref:ABC transporter permease n=1 Tax=Frankia sp. AgKG'84/4 TaxID=573490 RepID=UPI00200C0FAB|nr:ABC transporter permease [Frankia sp. AgKG'84/4]MCL9795568.1 ABC transporter permease [Frankia sp. AgKG'84/4]
MSTLTTTLPGQAPGPVERAAPTGPARVGPIEGLRHTATLSWRSLVQIKHNPMELLDFSVQPLMFLLLFTYVFGGAIAGSTGDYLTFALPGLMVQNTLFTTLNTGVGLNNDLTKGVFDRLRSLPIARSAPLAGRIVADMVKQTWAIAMMLGLGYILGFRVRTGPLDALAAFGLIILFALAISWASVLVGMLVSEPEKVMVFGFTLIFPLTFISNAFVQTSTMPGWLQAFVKINPVTALADATRGLLSSGPVATPVWHTLLWAAGIAAVFAPLAVNAFKRKV